MINSYSEFQPLQEVVIGQGYPPDYFVSRLARQFDLKPRLCYNNNMKLTEHSRNRMRMSASHWSVPAEYFDPVYNYLVHGFEPGSFWTAVLANDFARAIQSSHPANSIPALKNTVGWMRDQWPTMSYGNLQVVHHWLELDAAERRRHLEDARLIYSEQDEIMMTLRDQHTYDFLSN